MTPIEDVLLHSLAQAGDRYVFGAEVPLDATDSDEWDCSELVQWSCARAGVRPTVPDGAYWQWRHSMGIPVAQGIHTRGALLFVGDGTGVGRDAITHCAWSLGDGTTIEARGSRWGVGSWPSAARFDFAGLLPGVDYSQEDNMATYADQLNRIEQRVNDCARGIVIVAGAVAELDADLPENAAAELDELRVNLRTALEALDVPEDDIER